MRCLLLGAGGMLAKDILAGAPPDVEIIAFSRGDVDITDSHAVVQGVDQARPDLIINAAAYTRVDRAETEFETALAVNGTAVARLGELCAARGISLVHFSTDYVFRGDASCPYREDAPVDPLNAYGRSKAEGERGLLRAGARALILRTQWLYGLHGKSFPRTMWERACRREPTRVVVDQVGIPTYTVDVARAAWDLVRRNASGIYHVVNAGNATTWFDVASVVFEAAAARDALTPCTTADYPTPALRPRYAVMDTGRLARDHAITLPPWRDSLDTFLALLPECVPARPS